MVAGLVVTVNFETCGSGAVEQAEANKLDSRNQS